MSSSIQAEGAASFVVGPAAAEATAVIVTYNSAADVDHLLASLRAQAGDVALRVVVVDNSSTDETIARLAGWSDVTTVSSGGNLGYSGGINVGLRLVPKGEHVLILNPDLTLDPGAVRALLTRMERNSAGVVVPIIRGASGELFPSLRREPGVLRALGDAAFGARYPGRPAALSDIDADPGSYTSAHAVDWASGAALLIRGDIVEEVGPWDERFFLYSEETDFQRRVRAAGHSVWFEPAATARHRKGGSGESPQLAALMAVNRVRYVEKYHGPLYSSAYRAVVLLHELVRAGKPGHVQALRAVASRGAWRDLPRARPDLPAEVRGAVIIPAHNEERVIARTLRSLGSLLAEPELEVIVVCNGTTDDTAEIARSFDGVRVVEIEDASKVAALNVGDRTASRWPRLYLDADIEIDPSAVAAVFGALSRMDDTGTLLLEAARPAARYDATGGTALVRSYYRARARMPEMDDALWGAGAYAVNETGHARFDEFPQLTADDLFIDRVFPRERKAVIATDPVVVRLPRDAANLSRILRRGVRAQAEHSGGSTTRRTAQSLLRSIRGPVSAADAVVYAGFVVAARLRVALGSTGQPRWERDVSSR